MAIIELVDRVTVDNSENVAANESNSVKSNAKSSDKIFDSDKEQNKAEKSTSSTKKDVKKKSDASNEEASNNVKLAKAPKKIEFVKKSDSDVDNKQ